MYYRAGAVTNIEVAVGQARAGKAAVLCTIEGFITFDPYTANIAAVWISPDWTEHCEFIVRHWDDEGKR